jgi:predicted GH43/DUF377 family glycosyl hydrolase
MWNKKGLIYKVAGTEKLFKSHSHKPTLLVLNDRLRIYFGVRDSRKRTRTTYIETKLDDPSQILYIHDQPVLDIGKLGTFDDAGANVSCIVERGDSLFMYYIGWNTSTTVPMRNSIGLAISKDNGKTFARYADGPIMDRIPNEPYFTVAPYVLVENGIWKMWYTSGTGWEVIDGRPEIKYHIKYAESLDGINWRRDNINCIYPNNEYEITARPFVTRVNGTYRMWYCYRNIEGFRTNAQKSYRIGYAESNDGLDWERLDDRTGIDLSKEGWDSEMIAYPALYKYKEKEYLVYNGNGFGESGIGYAMRDYLRSED